MFSCCRGFQDEDEEDLKPRKALVISGPTNFRREEINIPGLTPSQERFVREKAARDASQLYANLQPLASSPSGTFAERPATNPNPPNFPTYEQFTQPRSAPSPSSRIDRVMAHGRKLSDTFRHSLGAVHPVGSGGAGSGAGGGYHAVGSRSREGSETLEMRALMEPSSTKVGGESPRVGGGDGKMSEESFSRTTMTEESSVEREGEVKKGVDLKL